jgi:histidine ammonia-lyase
VPTSGGQEDHVSMGWNACRSLRLAVEDITRLVAIEAVCAAEATELRGLPPGVATQAAIACIRREIPRMDVDRFLAPDLETATQLVARGTLLDAVEMAVGALS